MNFFKYLEKISLREFYNSYYFLNFLILIFISFKNLYYLNHVPIIEDGGDSVRYWLKARELALNTENFVPTEHFFIETRWGIWIIHYFVIRLFSSDILNYYLTNFIIFNSGLTVFIIICWKYVRSTGTIIFVIFSLIDAGLWRFNFQLLPTTITVLPLALSIYFSLKLFYEDKKIKKITYTLIVTFCLFYLYGIKETNLFFIPGFLYIIITKDKSLLKYFFLVFGLLFFAEGFLLKNIILDNSFWNRIYYYLFDLSFNPEVLVDSNFYDNGMTFRWYAARANHTFLFFTSFLSALILINNSSIRQINIIIYFFFSYIFFTSFFIISVDPITLGQPLRKRYTVILLMLSNIIILYFLKEKFKDVKFKKITLISLTIFCFFYFSNDIAGIKFNKNYGKYEVKKLPEQIKFFKDVELKINNYDCLSTSVQNADRLAFLVKVIPYENLNEKIKKIFLSKVITSDDGYAYLNINNNCTKKLNF